MKIRLLTIDSKIPNYAIMKISSYHKKLGDDVNWYDHLFDYYDTDILYISKVFTFSKMTKYLPINAKIIIGGSGYNYSIKLPQEIENSDLDYSLYPKCDYSIVFTTRGCIRKCPFCIVNKKEGLIHNVKFPNLNKNSKYIKILDNNFFAFKGWKDNLNVLNSFNLPLEFNQGIDLRILNEEQCQALKQSKIKIVYCAWDNYKDKEVILSKLKMLIKYVKAYKITVYVLVGFENKNIVETDIERVLTLRNLGVKPFAMGYIDFDNPFYKKPKEINEFCRWVNMKATFNSCSFDHYGESIEKVDKCQMVLF